MEQNDFLKGALVGGVLGGLAALLLAPKAGKNLRADICDGYDSINKHSHNLVDSFKEQSNNLLNKFNGEAEEEESSHTMLIGGAVGTVVGLLAALLLAPESGCKLRERLGDKYEEIQSKAAKAAKGFDKTRHSIEDKIDDWKDLLSTVVSKFSDVKSGKRSSSKSNDIFELASLGLRLYDQFQKRR